MAIKQARRQTRAWSAQEETHAIATPHARSGTIGVSGRSFQASVCGGCSITFMRETSAPPRQSSITMCICTQPHEREGGSHTKLTHATHARNSVARAW
eukprot:3839272-Pleurochrysis_carterae.AAC.1